MPTNPYIGGDKTQQLAMLLMSLGSGFGAAGAAGRPFYEGLAPAAGMFGNAMAQQQQFEQSRRDREEMADLRRRGMVLQESEYADKKAERDRQAQVAMGYTPPGASTPGMGVPASIPTMGPQQAGLDLYNYFTKEKGLGPAQAAAVVGNFAQESGFNPSAVHDNGTGYGVGGWRLDRRDALQRYAQLRGGNVNDTKLQADFFLDEIKTRPEYQQFSAAQSPQEAATALMHYFRPAGYTPNNPTAGHGYGNRVGYANAYANAGPQLPPSPQRPIGTMLAQGSGEGMPVAVPPPSPPMVPRPALPAEDAARIQNAVRLRQITPQQGDAEANRIVTDLHNRAQDQANRAWQQQNEQYRFDRGEAAKTEAWYPLGADDVKMFPNLDPSKTYQRNKRTGEIKPVGGSLVNIEQKGETEFSKEIGKNDAKRLGQIQENTQTVLDTVGKIRAANDFLRQTYTGPGAEYANAWHRTLGSLGVESAKNKADAATAGLAVIAELTPKMRPPGSGATSDFEMQLFGRSLVSLLNSPGGNEKVAQYWDRIGERALKIQEIAERYATENKRLTGTEFAKEIKELGPLFSKEEIAEMQGVGKANKAAPPADMPPLESFRSGKAYTPMPGQPQRPPIASFGGAR